MKVSVLSKQGFALLLFLLGICREGFSEQDPLKMGLVTAEDVKMNVYAKDTSAAAVVLYDYGESSFLFTKGTQVQFKRTMRIKILKKAGLEQADIIIPFYTKNPQNKEEVLDVKGFTYNLENGNVAKVKLDEKAIFEEKQDVNWSLKKVTMPNVKVGSVLELSYTIKSDFIENLREWEFQNTIPVVWSEYRVSMVPFFEYTHLLRGFLPFHVSDSKVMHKTATIVWKEEVGMTRVDRRANLSMPVVQYRWVMQDVPAFTYEPYLASIDDYLAKLEFTLSKVQYPEQNPQYMTNTWDSFTAELLKEEQFGGQLQSAGFLKKTTEALLAGKTDTLAKVKALLSYVNTQVQWDGKNRVFSESIKKAHDTRKGSSADINLLLTALLREAGIRANPMLLSTRLHGKPITEVPMLSKFNYVITHVKVGNATYLLDATEKDLPFGMLPYRCLNEKGWVAYLPEGRWVPIQNSEKNIQMFTAQMEIKPTGEITGTLEETHQGIAALQARSDIKENGQESYLKTFANPGHDWARRDVKIQNLDNLQEPLKKKYELTRTGDPQEAQLLYLSPMLLYGLDENPFKQASRNYPIDFATLSDEMYVFSYKLPEGYVVEEMPKSVDLLLPGSAAKFNYRVQVEDGKLQVMSRLNVNKAVFGPEEYANLRELYARMVAKHAEKIVLKKKM